MTVLQYLDFSATDFTKLYPNIYPGIGSVWFISWADFEPTKGQFNYAKIDAWIQAESANKLLDGSPKPLACFLFTQEAPKASHPQGEDLSPSWVKAACPSLKATVTVNGAASTAILPAYNNLQWWKFYSAAVIAFTEYLSKFPAVKFIRIAHGCDGELWPLKAPWNARTPGGVQPMFDQQTVLLFDVYKAHTTKTLLAVLTGPGRKFLCEQAIARKIGVQMCGAQRSVQDAEAGGGDIGSWTSLDMAHKAGVPAVCETTMGWLPGDSKQYRYWTILGMLNLKIDAMGAMPDWFQDLPQPIWTWAIAHMGVTEQTTPSAWWVAHDYDPDYKMVGWTSSNPPYIYNWQSDWRGDYKFFLSCTDTPEYQLTNAPRVMNVGPSGALESWQCRLIVKSNFKIESFADKEWFKVTVRWLNQDVRTFNLIDDRNVYKGISQGTNAWENSEFVIHGHTFSIEAPGIAGIPIHRIDVVPTTAPVPPFDIQVCKDAITKAEAALATASGRIEQATLAYSRAVADMTTIISKLADALAATDLAKEALSTSDMELGLASEQLDSANTALVQAKTELEKHQ